MESQNKIVKIGNVQQMNQEETKIFLEKLKQAFSGICKVWLTSDRDKIQKTCEKSLLSIDSQGRPIVKGLTWIK